MGPFLFIALGIFGVFVFASAIIFYFIDKWQNKDGENFISKEEYDKQQQLKQEKMKKSVEHKKGKKIS